MQWFLGFPVVRALRKCVGFASPWRRGRPSAASISSNQKCPETDDKNDGSEAKPFKTIQAAVDLAKPGDTIYVKAGSYVDSVRIFKKSGTVDQPITITAWKDDRVHIGFTPRPLPAAQAWKPIAGSKSFSTVLPEPVPDDMLVLADDKPVVTQLKDAPPKDNQLIWATYRKSDRTLMFNANGKNPAEGVTLRYIRKYEPFQVQFSDYWNIRKIEFAYSSYGIGMGGSSCIIEDCFFHNIAHAAIFFPGGHSIQIRRCNFYRCGYGIQGGGVAPLIEDNLLVECGQSPDEAVDVPRLGRAEGGGPTLFKGCSVCMIFRYNTISEGHAGAGWYSDIGAKSCRIIGNAFWNNTVRRHLQRVDRGRHARHRQLLSPEQRGQLLVLAIQRPRQLLRPEHRRLEQPRPLPSAEKLHDDAGQCVRRSARRVPEPLRPGMVADGVSRGVFQLPGGLQPPPRQEGRRAYQRRRLGQAGQEPSRTSARFTAGSFTARSSRTTRKTTT